MTIASKRAPKAKAKSRAKAKSKPKQRQAKSQAKARGAKASTVDEYLARLSAEQRAALERLRTQIRKVAPRAEECISYQLPAFRLDGRMLVWLGATANHCAFYPGAVVTAHARELEGFETSKGTIRFQPDKPLPSSLVRKLVQARIAVIRSRRPQSAGAASRA